MKKYNLQKWLERDETKKDNLEEYNLIADTQDEKEDDYGEIENPYEKFFIYKYIKEFQKDSILKKLGEETKKSFEEKANNYKSIKDPDSYSILLQKVYKLLWKNVAEKPFMRQEPDSIIKKEMEKIWEDRKKSASDAMTSVQGILTVALKNMIDEDGSKIENEDVSKRIQNMYNIFNNIQQKKGKKQEYWTKKFCVAVAADLSAAGLDEEFYKLIDKKYSIDEKDSALGEFINRCFTIGNYCPVPVGFNSARSGPGACHDYWDLTLMKIREWYISIDGYERDKLIYEDLLHNKGNSLECLRWLESFGQGQVGWHNFVDTLFMQDYVYNENNRLGKNYEVGKDDEKYYDVIPFWKTHTWQHPKLDDKTELDDEKIKEKIDERIKEALENISKMIEARSDRIVEELKKIEWLLCGYH